MNSDWKVHSEHLRPLHKIAMELQPNFKTCHFSYVQRALNSKADALANRAMDQKNEDAVVRHMMVK
jgi:hypothetical protein